MSIAGAESGVAPRNGGDSPPKRPWYASTGALIGAIVAGALGLVMLVAGIVAFTSAADVRAEAEALEAEAIAVAEEADAAEAQAAAAQEAASSLPELIAEVENQSYAVLTASEATVAARNALIDCSNAATEVDVLVACFRERTGPVATAVEEELLAVQTLDEAVAEARETLETAEAER